MTNVTNSHDTVDVTRISSTVEDYLSLIYVLERDKEPVVGAHLAELLHVSAPTVTNTLKRMVRDGLLTSTETGTHLTPQGWKAAHTVLRRHMLMEWMMARMLPWSKLHGEAHHLEHAISSMAESALMEELGHPKTCPHGNPLPGCEDAVAAWVPVTQLQVGDTGIVRRIHELAEENTELLGFMEEKNVMPGKHLRVAEILRFNQTITIEVEGSPVILGFAAARYVFVERPASE